MKITLISARNPKWADADGAMITLSCFFSHYPDEEMSFTASPTDGEAYGRDIFARASAGEFGKVAAYVAPHVVIPKSVEMRQARRALNAAGLLANIEAAIAAMPGLQGKDAQIEWEFSRTLQRDHPLTVAMVTQFGLSDAQLDTLFTAASKL